MLNTKKRGAERPSSTKDIKVWDPFIRVFHWSLVAGMLYEFIDDDGDKLHHYVGYGLAALVLMRLVWGFIGTKHARFSDFVCSRKVVLNYLRSMLTFHPKRYIGHNPAGGAMVLALMASILVTAFSGWMTTTDTFWGVSWVEELHEFCANFTLVLIVVHVAGVLLASIQHKENLVRSMWNGRKKP